MMRYGKFSAVVEPFRNPMRPISMPASSTLSYTLLQAITRPDMERMFPDAFLSRGEKYFREGRVEKMEFPKDGEVISGLVRGSGANAYRVYIRLARRTEGKVTVSGECTCPIGFNCKHVVALLLSAQTFAIQDAALFHAPDKPPAPGTSPVDSEVALPQEFTRWLLELEQATHPSADPDACPDGVSQRLLYVINLDNRYQTPWLEVHFFSSRLLKTGGFGKATQHHGLIGPYNREAPRYCTGRDRDILTAFNLQYLSGNTRQGLFGESGARLLPEMLATGRCFWKTVDSAPLIHGEKRSAQPGWVMDEQGLQKLVFDISPPARALPLCPPWYVDEKTGVCGALETGLPDAVALRLLEAPPVPGHLAASVGAALAKRLPIGKNLAPQAVTVRKFNDIVPQPCLRLFSAELPLIHRRGRYTRGLYSMENEIADLARLEFDYDGSRVGPDSRETELIQRHGAELRQIARHPQLEREHVETLTRQGFSRLKYCGRYASNKFDDALVLDDDEDEDAWLEFSLHEIPSLQARGWRVEMDESFRFNFAEVEGWTATVEEGGGNDWFGLELGIQVNGQPVNLLPVLVNMIREFPDQFDVRSLAQMADVDEAATFTGRLPDGRLLSLPVRRVRGILSVLLELYDKEANPERLELPLAQAARLLELEEAATGLRWMGGERLRELGKKLRDFQGVQPVPVPAGLKTDLRGYQQDGLNWLQFLREYGLAGILADDMGLGKTVQALAHLLVEKEAGRMEAPCLVVAPTSLMFNWQHEAEKFAPSLRVLVLQGALRKQHFETIQDYDLVLTTYPLLPRDKDVLTAQAFHYLILDEAHIIKNPKSQATRIVHQIQARHRLALTGTPLENHLGELWSLFHFLMPGLLGDSRQFVRLFRTPIEKQSDGERRMALSRRVAPFLLRRTKAQVAGELPAKTEMIRYCELGGAQRDLYEAIRVAMHEKVRQEIDRKGVNRSQIVILDALLKLRQACCDPRLLKLPSPKRVNESAKLELLMSLLPEMLEEGRRVLLFSQFTSMLDLIEQELAKHKIDYLKLTGDTVDRATPVKRFQNGEVPLFLISLKAGGVGLNLTAADTVIHYDPWWNPSVENQATDRAHRIGQENPVFVYKFIAEGTVEEKIVRLQEKKRDLALGVLEGGAREMAALTAEDLSSLFEPLGS